MKHVTPMIQRTAWQTEPTSVYVIPMFRTTQHLTTLSIQGTHFFSARFFSATFSSCCNVKLAQMTLNKVVPIQASCQISTVHEKRPSVTDCPTPPCFVSSVGGPSRGQKQHHEVQAATGRYGKPPRGAPKRRARPRARQASWTSSRGDRGRVARV